MKKNKNFTLMELVITLGIFTIGTVLAVEVVNASQLTAQCTENLRKMGQAQMLYTAENEGKMALDIFQLQPLMGFKKGDIPAVTGCPAVSAEKKRKRFYGAEYGKNAYIFTAKKYWAGNPQNPDETRNILADYATPEKTMMYMDFPPEPNGGLCAVHCNSAFIEKKDPAAFRHEGKINVLFLDGHVETLSEISKDNSTGFWGF